MARKAKYHIGVEKDMRRAQTRRYARSSWSADIYLCSSISYLEDIGHKQGQAGQQISMLYHMILGDTGHKQEDRQGQAGQQNLLSR